MHVLELHKIILIIFLGLVSELAIGQNVHGKVFDEETKKPIENVNIQLKSKNIGTISSTDGFFKLYVKNPKSIDSIKFSSIGYKSKTFGALDIINKKTNIYLSKNVENLEQVTIKSTFKRKNKIGYNKIAVMKIPVFSFGATIYNNKLYIACGNNSRIEDTNKKTLQEVNNIPEATFADFLKRQKANLSWEHYSNELQILDLIDNKWLSSIKLQSSRANLNSAVNNKKLYIIGGKSLSKNNKFEYLSNTIEIVDLESNKITIDYTNPHQAVDFLSVNFQDNLILMGGSIKQRRNGSLVYSDEAHIFNFTSGKWYELTNMTEPKEVTGVIIENKIYAVGGFNKKPLTKVESYDLSSGKWETEVNLPYGIARPSLCTHENSIYIFYDGSIFVYNTKSKKLSEYKIDLHLKSSQILFYENMLLIAGGYNENDFSIIPSFNIYSIDIKEFSKTKSVSSN